MTDTLLFQRACTATVGTVRVEHRTGVGCRMSFRVTKTLKQEPNTLQLKLYNLAASTRARMQSTGVPVILSAGYPGNEAVIFSGDARAVDHIRDGADWITSVKCGDGERAYAWTQVSESFAPGIAIGDVIRFVVRAMGIGSGNLEAALSGPLRGGLTQFKHGYTLHGKASVQLDTLMRTVGFSWSIQNGALQVARGTAPVPGQAVLLTSTTGLIGSPEHNAPDRKNAVPLLKVKSLLQPAIVCGGIVQVQSAAVGPRQFRVESLEITGDTASTDWYSQAEVRPV